MTIVKIFGKDFICTIPLKSTAHLLRMSGVDETRQRPARFMSRDYCVSVNYAAIRVFAAANTLYEEGAALLPMAMLLVAVINSCNQQHSRVFFLYQISYITRN